MTALSRLAEALKGMTGPVLVELARAAGVPEIAARRAARSRCVCSDSYLKLCAAKGLDPVTGAARTPQALGDFHRNSLGCAFKMVRIQRKQNQRAFGKAAKLPATIVCRIERGEVVTVENMLAACAFMKRHPHDFVSPTASREAEQRSAA